MLFAWPRISANQDLIPVKAIFAAQNTQGSGKCPSTSTLSVPRNAKYRRIFFPGLVQAFKTVWGVERPPAEWTFEPQ